MVVVVGNEMQHHFYFKPIPSIFILFFYVVFLLKTFAHENPSFVQSLYFHRVQGMDKLFSRLTREQINQTSENEIRPKVSVKNYLPGYLVRVEISKTLRL